MKKIALIGGLGKIGQVIYKNLGHLFDFTIIDSQKSESLPVVHARVEDFQSLLDAIPKDTDIIFDLTAHLVPKRIIGPEDFEIMKQTFVQGIYNVFEVAKTLGIKKVIYSSTIHVVGMYEKDGYSLLGRKIREKDYPKPDGIYAAMKLYAESVGRVYSSIHHIKVICLRFGMVNERNRYYNKQTRNKRIILYHEDLITIISAVFKSDIGFGIYNAISENADKPLSLCKLRKDLGLKRHDFVARRNSSIFHKGYMKLHRFFSQGL